MEEHGQNSDFDPAQPPSAADAFDFAHARELVRSALRAPRRHPALCVLVFATTVAVCTLVAFAMPRTYQVDAKILTSRNLVMPSLGNPHRAVPTDSDAPTRGAPEVIQHFDNLVAIAKEANLVDRWDAHRAVVLRLKDQAMRPFMGPQTEDVRLRAMVGLLETRLKVQADETTIKLSLQWDDPRLAYEIVALAQRNFLDGRSASEVSAISDTIAILEDKARKEREALGSALAEVARLSPRPVPMPVKVTTTWRAPAPHTPAATTPEPANESNALAAELEKKRLAIRAIDEPRQRTLAELRAKLGDLQLTYAPAHPSVILLQKQIAAAMVEPPELAALKAEEAALLSKTAALAEPPSPTPAAPAGKPTVTTSTTVAPPSPQPTVTHDDPPELVVAREKLHATTFEYQELTSRIDAARIELETAKAAFKYRYLVVQPPEIPRRPIKPNAPLIIVGGVLFGAILALGLAIAKDVAGGRFIEPWQVRRRVGLPMLAEVDEP